ncbi:hypothetical protein [Psychrobacter sp. HY3-MNA-CIBAN-0198]|uniref:hypothetical protein n=1 Tax=Psychrobacter sp. HY3-MNA-CIBAN-0198 TaxID=3140441 RepID=UPI00332A0935
MQISNSYDYQSNPATKDTTDLLHIFIQFTALCVVSDVSRVVARLQSSCASRQGRSQTWKRIK